MLLRIFCAVCGLVWVTPAFANPEGAPWGSSDPDTFRSCAACHFDNEPVGRSPAIILAGMPETATPGEAYEMSLRFEAGAAPQAGFLLSASSGGFEAIDDFMEANNNEIRSVKPKPPENGAVTWSLRWRAPEEGSDGVIFNAAANAANDDQSPFGDKVHFRTFEIFGAPADE